MRLYLRQHVPLRRILKSFFLGILFCLLPLFFCRSWFVIIYLFTPFLPFQDGVFVVMAALESLSEVSPMRLEEGVHQVHDYRDFVAGLKLRPCSAWGMYVWARGGCGGDQGLIVHRTQGESSCLRRCFKGGL